MSEDTADQSDSDRRIGANLKSARNRAELSQDHVADAMREVGFKWSNRTVWQVESGSRPLRVAEAHELLRILKGGGLQQVDQLIQSKYARRLRGEMAAFGYASAEFRNALTKVFKRGQEVARTVNAAREDPEELDDDTLDLVASAAQTIQDQHPARIFHRWLERRVSSGEGNQITPEFSQAIAQVIEAHSDSFGYLDPQVELERKEWLPQRSRSPHSEDSPDAEAD